MIKELFKIQNEPSLSDFVKQSNIIETPISPNIGQALHRSSSTTIAASKNNIEKVRSYSPPKPVISKSKLSEITNMKSFNSKVDDQPQQENTSKVSLSSSGGQTTMTKNASQPRIVRNEAQEKDRKVFSGMVDSLLDNWMETRDVDDTT